MRKQLRRQISVGGVLIGDGAPVTVQSMTTTKTADAEATVAQILQLERAGCDIVRVAVPDELSARAIERIKARINIPLVADIHFDYKLALLSVEAGADKIRINPGNIGSEENVRRVAEACRAHNIPIRIGVNSGSLEHDILARRGVSPEAMVESAMRHIELLNRFDFDDICVSVKASEVPLMIASYRLLQDMMLYPLHLGVTEAGTEFAGIIKSAVGIGALLADGIGDTIRVSLTADPVREVQAGLELLKSLDLRRGVRLISCPTCGRCKIDLIALARDVERRLEGLNADITVAVMGCPVNGPGEAREADFGIAGGDGEGVLFAHGEVVGKVSADKLADALMTLIANSLHNK
ncbi:MAG: flavodoxin-dependent (E)-4-hydroxy-3-methylbut-2-enyl-diphosphate synthase [Oscillospiraceae bacterium]|jgi:(E)-4-hydroxy-3-methylbut-2-enyl-diphosphate synthase|nr:flavodoxin-dependent (E)-4-hydroxy-3-methylbut-2-enyl-diphosphate synthase [Oscillospiraceae bacterium]